MKSGTQLILTSVPGCRKQGLARKLMDMLEEITEKVHAGYFVDLFVRVSNTAAIQMYKKVSACIATILWRLKKVQLGANPWGAAVWVHRVSAGPGVLQWKGGRL